MRRLIAVIAILTVVKGKLLDVENIIETVNNAQTTWKAGHNFAPDTTYEHIKRLMGVKINKNWPKLPLVSYSGLEIPEEFDARKEWSKCPSISHIRDQGHCGSCWAAAAASAFSDRVCIASNGTFTASLSIEELVSCCTTCGDGCFGGIPMLAWQYFVSNGIVTGGDYNSNEGCQPYTIEPCEHYQNGSRPTCSTGPYVPTPQCKTQCVSEDIDFSKDHHKAKKSYFIDMDEKAIQEEIFKYGPVEADFTVFEDFLTYKSGVYQHIAGSVVGAHAVRIIGYGTEKNTPYWLVANSWNTDWGDEGFFKIVRGIDECGFESDVVAGTL